MHCRNMNGSTAQDRTAPAGEATGISRSDLACSLVKVVQTDATREPQS